METRSLGQLRVAIFMASNLCGIEIAWWRGDVCVLQCFPMCSLFLLSQMPLWAWWMAGTTVRGALRSTTMGVGAQSVITPGTSMTPQLCAGSWTVALQFQRQEMPILDKAQAQFTWTMCSARGTSRPSLSAGAVAGACTAVTTLRMPAWSAQVPLIVLPKSCYLGWWIGPALPGMGMSWSHVCRTVFCRAPMGDGPAETPTLCIAAWQGSTAIPSAGSKPGVLLPPSVPYLLLSLPASTGANTSTLVPTSPPSSTPGMYVICIYLFLLIFVWVFVYISYLKVLSFIVFNKILNFPRYLLTCETLPFTLPLLWLPCESILASVTFLISHMLYAILASFCSFLSCMFMH